jgi:hypothetical protein
MIREPAGRFNAAEYAGSAAIWNARYPSHSSLGRELERTFALFPGNLQLGPTSALAGSYLEISIT